MLCSTLRSFAVTDDRGAASTFAALGRELLLTGPLAADADYAASGPPSPHLRPPRRGQAAVGNPDLRGQRLGGRLRGPRRQDHRAAARRAEGLDAAGAEHEGEKVVKLVKGFVKRRNPDVRIKAAKAAPAYRGVTEGPYFESVKEAMKFAFGKNPVIVREGGTIGAVLSWSRSSSARSCSWACRSRAWLSRRQREFRLGPGRRRYRGLRQVLRGRRRALATGCIADVVAV